MYRLLLLFFLLSFFISGSSQIISGPMLGPVELRDAKIWLEVAPSVKEIKLLYHKKDEASKTKFIVHKNIGNKKFHPLQLTIGDLDINTTYQYSFVIDGKPVNKKFHPVQITIGDLDINTTYQYSFVIDGKPVNKKGFFTTKDLWQWRKPAPDFSFLAGSCAYFNEPTYDRPGKPYGGDSSIFETMAKEDAAFMLWLGDNWYTREVDFYSDWGLWYRAHHGRKSSVLQNFLKAMPHLAMWDDHDFGPDNSGSNFVLKETSREIFKNYWCNPSHGENEQGVYTKYSYSDVDVFLCDDRWWRSADHWKDSVNGQPNPEKIILGTKQMTWLKNSLLHSKATFKIIMIGTQVLNQSSSGEGFSNFPIEYNELMNFLLEYKISGVLFLTGDRHHSEIIKMNRPGTYTLFDITVSPLTSGISKVANNDINNPDRIMNAIEQYNYARFSFTGAAGNRKLQVNFLGTKGEQLGEWSITEKELKN